MFVLNIYNNNKYVVFALRCQQSSDRLSEVDGVLLPKAKTPFSVLWGDYDLETK